ncbi:MAG: hypothetical protein IJX88_06630 [Clostridia bacterium]|nr:hypothetical protein [Clostridia bacterium]
MKITDVISITELSKILNKSRPTVYKYVSDFENGKYGGIPHSVKKLFLQIQAGSIPKREIYEYGEYWFSSGSTPSGSFEKGKATKLKDIFKLLKDNERSLDLEKIKEFINKELTK